MKIRPGRTRSILGGIMALAVMGVGLWMLSHFGGFGSPPWSFVLVWVAVGLGGAAVAFYNAFSKRGLPLYEVDVDAAEKGFCPRCGNAIDSDDLFCRQCGASLK